MTTEKDLLKTNKKTPPPIVFILIGLLVTGSIYWRKTHEKPDFQQQLPLNQSQSISDRISLGSKILVMMGATSQKQAGVEAFAAQDYGTAIAQFQTSLQKYRNDPETLIYLNNAKAGNNVKIAVSVPIGSNLNVAQEMLRGVAQAQDEVNQNGGINGVKLQVEIVNDENAPEIAQQVATELVNDKRILAVVGHNSSNATLSAAPVYQQGGLVMVTPTSLANNLSGLGSYIFRTVPTIRFMADPLAQYAVKTVRKTHIAVCLDSQAPDNLSFKDEFVASLAAKGGQMVSTVCDFASPAFNPSTAIAQAISSGADGMLLSPHVDRLDRAIDIARANKGRLSLFGSPTLYTIKTLETGQSDVNGLVLPVPWHPNSTDPFLANARKLWGGTVNWRTAMAYDATRAIITGLQQSSTRDGLQRVMRSPGFSAMGTSQIRFLPTGDRVANPILVQVQYGSSGYDFVPLQP